MACVLLPCEVEEWWEDKRLFLLLSNLRTVCDLETLIDSHTRQGCEDTTLSKRFKALSGLLVFLKDFCVDEERHKYITVTLPFIARCAAKLDELVPESGIPFIVQNEAASLVLGRKLVLSLLANAFLCTFPKPEYKNDIRTFSFDIMFATFIEKRPKRPSAIAGKVKCFLCYFHTVAEGRADLSGVITIKRQVINNTELPKLSEWTSCRKPLCDLVVDHKGTIETSGSHTLQTDFANEKIGGGAFRSGCVQEEIRFTICPELSISMLVMDHMSSNEAIIINGAEQFSSYIGYSDTFEFAGEHKDPAERDVFGNVLTSTVAIDALFFGYDPEKQYQQDSILRELNKAYTGFICLQDRGDIPPELIALNNQGPLGAYIAKYYPSHRLNTSSGLVNSALGNMSSSQPSIHIIASHKPMAGISDSIQTLSPIHELSESAVCSNITVIEEVASEGSKQQAVDKYADSLSRSLLGGTEKKKTVDDFASDLASSLFSSVQSVAKGIDTEDVDKFASSMTASLFDNIGANIDTKDEVPTGVNALAFSLSSTILKSTVNDSTADRIARNIISDVFSTLTPASSPSALLAQTQGEATDQSLSSFSNKMANSILSSAMSTPNKTVEHPAIYIQVERRGSSGVNESPKSSRSSSLTGQTITVHEFTDDLAENLIRDGLSIAQYTSQSMELNILPQVDENDAQAIAEKMTKSIMCDVIDGCKVAPPKTLPVGEHVSSSSRHNLRQRLLFSKHELAIVAARMGKHGSFDHTELTDMDIPFQLNPRLLTPSSSRHSVGYAWSNASTRDDGSRPVSPTDLDRLALGLATDTEDYSNLFSKILISDAILSVSGERPRRQIQNYSFLNLSSLSNENKIDAYFSCLEQGSPDEPVSQPHSLPRQQLKKVPLRPVATGNWGCGAFHGNPQLKALLQLIVVSMCDRPQMIYYPFENEQLKQFERVYDHLTVMHWSCGKLCKAVLDYAQLPNKERAEKDIFTALLEK